jgi:hypothetical protein
MAMDAKFRAARLFAGWRWRKGQVSDLKSVEKGASSTLALHFVVLAGSRRSAGLGLLVGWARLVPSSGAFCQVLALGLLAQKLLVGLWLPLRAEGASRCCGR